ncbi:MAG: phosphoglycerate kinase [bacterium]
MNLNLPSIRDVKDLRGKTVLLRVDLNVPVKDGKVTDPFRIDRSIETIRFLSQSGAKTVLLSHLEDDKGTLEPIARYLVATFPTLVFIKDIFAPQTKKDVSSMKEGNVILFENLRNWPGEKQNDQNFANYLAGFAEYYVNEAFSVSHRNHASIVLLPKLLPSFIGIEFEREIKELSLAFHPDHPFVLIVGGVKFDTKFPLIKKFFNIADKIFIGGAIASSFFKHQGLFVGDSVVFDAPEIKNFDEAIKEGKVILPIDIRVQSKGFINIKRPDQISVGEKIWDMGPETEKELAKIISDAKFIVWNGPMGYFEEGAVLGNNACAKAVSESKATSIVGGGDTLASIKDLDIMNKIYFVSTGGGAMLDFLANGTLPGIEAIEKEIKPEEVSWIKKIFS